MDMDCDWLWIFILPFYNFKFVCEFVVYYFFVTIFSYYYAIVMGHFSSLILFDYILIAVDI